MSIIRVYPKAVVRLANLDYDGEHRAQTTIAMVNKDEFYTLVHKWLERCGEEEYIVDHVYDIPSCLFSDLGIADEVWDYVGAYNDQHLYEWSVFEAAMECSIDYDKVEQAYVGKFKDFKDLAEHLVDCGYFGNIPDYVLRYLDYELIALDLDDEYFEDNGHFFLRTY